MHNIHTRSQSRPKKIYKFRIRNYFFNRLTLVSRQVEAHEMEIQKLYDKLDTQIEAERHDMSSHVSNSTTYNHRKFSLVDREIRTFLLISI